MKDRTNNNISKQNFNSAISISKRILILDSPDSLKLIGDSVELPPFEIEVNLSAKAEEKLKVNNETIIVSAAFTGIPKDTTSKDYLQWGEIAIAHSEIELKNNRIAKFQNVKFSKARYNSLANKDIDLLINIFSGRRSTNVNLLDCDILQDKMSNVKEKKFTLKGKLIGESGSFNFN